MIYLTNAMSVHMLERMSCGERCTLSLERISCAQAKELLQGSRFRSYFGHYDTVAHLERYLRIHIPISREWVRIVPGDTVIIATLGSTREFEHGRKPNRMFEFYMMTYEKRSKQ